MNKRLTDNEFHTSGNKERACYIQEPRLQAIYDKLFDLEDIEEELGVDLVTLFKALKNGIYEKFEDGEYIKFNGLCMSIKSHKLKLNVNKKCLERGNDYFYFKDYGKTWALDKKELMREELENEIS